MGNVFFREMDKKHRSQYKNFEQDFLKKFRAKYPSLKLSQLKNKAFSEWNTLKKRQGFPRNVLLDAKDTKLSLES